MGVRGRSRRAEEIITALISLGWLPRARDEHERGLLLATEDMARRCWSLFQYRTRELLRQPPLQSAVIALANALLAEERIDAARTARIIRTGIAEADPDLLGRMSLHQVQLPFDQASKGNFLRPRCRY